MTWLIKHIFPTISSNKGIQTIKVVRLIEGNMRNNFFEKSYTKFGGETITAASAKERWVRITKYENVELTEKGLRFC